MTTAAAAPARPADWHAANQQHLMEALKRLRTLLEQGGERGAEPPPARSVKAGGRPPALQEVTRLFHLSPFEQDVLLLCAGVELDADFAGLIAKLQGDPQRIHPTFSLALTLLPGAHWSALGPGAALRRWRLIEAGPGVGLTAAPLRIDERVLHYLAGVAVPDERLSGIVLPVRVPEELAPSHREVAELIAAAWRRAGGGPAGPLVQLVGDAVLETYAVAAFACRTVGLGLGAMAADAIPSVPHESETLSRIWQREAVLSTSALLIDCSDIDAADGARSLALTRFIEQLHGPVLLAGRERRLFRRRQVVSLDIGRGTAAERRAAWQRILGQGAAHLDGELETLVDQFALGEGAIQAAAVEASGRVAAGEETLAAALWMACRSQARPDLDDLAQRIEPAAGWEDLILPEPQRQLLRDIAAQVRRRARVYEDWGLAHQGSRGLGISVLFAGSSGTGKTMAAEVLAGELQLDLYRIDLSSVVSKYIGETEKNLRRVFDAAERGGAILLFDEADALFGKRSEVKDSHDRYANIEVSYLLQRMESYRGLAILTTNLKAALDPAFLRRLRFIVQFPFPDAAQRAQIWGRIYPPETPTRGLAAERLAQLEVAGGNIRSIALNAAFLAADAGDPVSMRHLLQATRAECSKLEKALTDAETAGWE